MAPSDRIANGRRLKVENEDLTAMPPHGRHPIAGVTQRDGMNQIVNDLENHDRKAAGRNPNEVTARRARNDVPTPLTPRHANIENTRTENTGTQIIGTQIIGTQIIGTVITGTHIIEIEKMTSTTNGGRDPRLAAWISGLTDSSAKWPLCGKRCRCCVKSPSVRGQAWLRIAPCPPWQIDLDLSPRWLAGPMATVQRLGEIPIPASPPSVLQEKQANGLNHLALRLSVAVVPMVRITRTPDATDPIMTDLIMSGPIVMGPIVTIAIEERIRNKT